KVDRIGLGIALDVGRLAFLQRFEVAELVQAENADVPEARVEHVAFVDKQLAADDLIAGGGVTAEIDAAHEELLAFIDRKRHIDGAVFRVRLKSGLADEIDESELAVKLAHVLNAFAQFGGGENVVLGHPEQGAHQGLWRPEEFYAREADGMQAI